MSDRLDGLGVLAPLLPCYDDFCSKCVWSVGSRKLLLWVCPASDGLREPIVLWMFSDLWC
jgi:hypothetical protein